MSVLEAPPRAYPTRGGVAMAAAPERRATPRPAPPRDPRHLRVVVPREQPRRRLTPAAGVLMTAVLFVVLFAVAIAQTVLVQGQIRLDALDKQLAVEQAHYRVLRNQVAEMESPARVVAAARQLGMVAPDDLVYLQPGAVEGSREADGPSADDGGEAQGTGWSAMKPLLEAPAQ